MPKTWGYRTTSRYGLELLILLLAILIMASAALNRHTFSSWSLCLWLANLDTQGAGLLSRCRSITYRADDLLLFFYGKPVSRRFFFSNEGTRAAVKKTITLQLLMKLTYFDDVAKDICIVVSRTVPPPSPELELALLNTHRSTGPDDVNKSVLLGTKLPLSGL